jgi:hypothetical protein
MANALIDDESRLDALETNIESYRISRDSWTVLVLAVAFFAAIVSVVGIGLALRAADDDGGGALAGVSRCTPNSRSSRSASRPRRSPAPAR